MIDIKGLKFNNYVFSVLSKDEKIYNQVKGFDFDSNKVKLERRWFDLDTVSPILLSKELLSKCGFYKVAALLGAEIEVGIYHISMNGYCLSLLDELGLTFCLCSNNDYSEYDMITPLRTVNYVHEIQNIYFDLTGNELVFNL